MPLHAVLLPATQVHIGKVHAWAYTIRTTTSLARHHDGAHAKRTRCGCTRPGACGGAGRRSRATDAASRSAPPRTRQPTWPPTPPQPHGRVPLESRRSPWQGLGFSPGYQHAMVGFSRGAQGISRPRRASAWGRSSATGRRDVAHGERVVSLPAFAVLKCASQ